MFSHESADWVKEILGSGVMSVGLLNDGVTSNVLRVETIDNRSVVLKQYVDPSTHSTAADRIRAEIAAFELLGPSAVPVPEVLGSDAEGLRAGAPSLLMSWLPGTCATLCAEAELEALRSLLRSLRAVPVPEQPGADAAGQRLVHGDLHLRNVLWAGGSITGVLGWTEWHVGSAETDENCLRACLENNTADAPCGCVGGESFQTRTST